jgi:hypothetical protein
VLRAGGVVVHGWSNGTPVFKELWDAWRAAIPSQQAEDVGVRWEKNPTVLAEQGWHPAGDALTYSYHHTQRPATFLERLQNRIWSQTWRLSDKELAHGLEAVKDVLKRDFPNPEQPMTVTANFHVRAYLPPKPD